MNRNPFEILDSILENDKKFVILAGAGMSRRSPANVPSATEFMYQIIDKIAPDEIVRNLLFELTNPARVNRRTKGDFLRFEMLMQILYDHCDRDLDILNCYNDFNLYNLNHYLLAKMIQSGHVVLTTNFDNLIEISGNSFNFEIKQICYGNEFERVLNEYNKHKRLPLALFKLHGTLIDLAGNSRKETIKATLKQVARTGEVLNFEPAKKELLQIILQDYDLIVMGYSGQDDFDLGPFLKSVASERKIIWINHIDENIHPARYYKWSELLSTSRDRSGFFLESRVEILTEIGLSKKRSIRNLYLFDMNTDEIIEFLNKKYLDSSNTPKFERTYKFNLKEYIRQWAANHIAHKGEQYYLSGLILEALQRFDESIFLFKKGIKSYKIKQDLKSVAFGFKRTGDFYKLNGKFELALNNYQKSLELANECNYERGISTALLDIANIYRNIGIIDKAEDFYKKSLEIAEKIDDEMHSAAAYGSLALLHSDKGEYQFSLDLFQKALDIHKKLGEQDNISKDLANMADDYRNLGQVNNALNLLDQAIAIDRELGNIQQLGSRLNNKGLIYRSSGNQEKALKCFNEAASLAEEINDIKSFTQAKGNFYLIIWDQGKFKEAEKGFQELLDLHKKLKMKSEEARDLGNLGQLYYEIGKYDLAIEYLNKVLYLHDELKDKTMSAQQYLNLGNTYRKIGDKDRMIDCYNNAEKLYNEVDNPRGLANILGTKGLLLKDEKDYANAVKYFKKAKRLHSKVGETSYLMFDWINIGDSYYDQGKNKRALEAYINALKLTRKIDDKERQAFLNKKIGFVYKEIGNVDAAKSSFKAAFQYYQFIKNDKLVNELKKLIDEI